jgi:hypothetical protein
MKRLAFVGLGAAAGFSAALMLFPPTNSSTFSAMRSSAFGLTMFTP